jgi:hypothetical protein
LASVHIPVLETATGVVGLDGEAHFEVSICMGFLCFVDRIFRIFFGGNFGSGVYW